MRLISRQGKVLLVVCLVIAAAMLALFYVGSENGAPDMANNFLADPNCKALWRFEPGGLYADSIGGNTLEEHDYNTESDTCAESTTVGYYKEGSGGVQTFNPDIDTSTQLQVADADMDAGFPLRAGDADKIISVSGWFRFTSDHSGDGYIAAKWIGGTRSFIFMLRQTTGEYRLRVYYSGSSYITIDTSGAGLAANKWYHFGLAIDGANKTYLLRSYDADGDTAQTFSGSLSQELQVGDCSFDLGYSIDGYLDEVVVFDRLLDADEFDQIREGAFAFGSSISASPSSSPSIGEDENVFLDHIRAAWQDIAPASLWSLDAAVPRREIYIATLRATGLDDLEVPMASMQLRRRDGYPTMVSCVVPDAMTYLAAAEARKGGELIIQAGSMTEDGTRHLSELDRATLEDVTYDHGVGSSSLTLSGYRTVTTENPRPVDLEGITYYALQADGKRRVRGKVNIFLRPGDTAVWEDQEMVVDQIYISVYPADAWMEVAGL